MDTTTLKSGRVLALSMAPFSVGTKLFKTVLAEIRAVNIEITKLDPNMEINLSKLDPKLLNMLKDLFCEIASSDVVETTLFECFARCTLGGHKITRDTFEPAEMRQDYLPAALEVMKYNLTPFFRGLDLSSLISVAPSEPGQK